MRGIRIGSAFGIPIRLDLTFLLVLPLFAWLIGAGVADTTVALNGALDAGIDADALTDGATPWILGTAAALGLFFGILLHEFGHALTAMRYGVEIESITLWLLGGLARFAEMPEHWKEELVIAIVGPIVSVLVGVLAYALFLVTPESLFAARFVLGYLALVNVALAAFNMLPGFPMDGGRVLRALLARRRPYAQATQMAAEVGKVFAFLLGIFGLFTNLFLVVLAFFIYIAAAGEAQQTVLRAAFEDVTVEEIMTPAEELSTATGDMSVADLLDRMLRERHTGYPVMRDGELIGMVTLDDARDVNEVERDAYRVEDVMSTDVASVTPDTGVVDAIETMQREGVGRLPVVDERGTVVGLISRTDVMTALNIIQSRGASGGVTTGRRDSLPDVR